MGRGAAAPRLPGGGAAGGFGAGAAAFFASPLQMGIDVVLALTDFDRRAADAALVITGDVAAVQSALTEVMNTLCGMMGFASAPITKT